MIQDETTPWSPQDALIAMMVAISVSDQNIKTLELLSIERTVNHLPIFADYYLDHLKIVSKACFVLVAVEVGLDALFGLVTAALPERLYETAYALCCDLAAPFLALDVYPL